MGKIMFFLSFQGFNPTDRGNTIIDVSDIN